MRAVLTLPLPGKNVALPEVISALEATTWLPRQIVPTPSWQQGGIDEMLKKLPEQTRAQLLDADKIMIQVGFSVDGLVSLEREQTVVIRLFHEGGSVDTIKNAVSNVAQHLPLAFQAAAGGELPSLEKSIEIRHTNSDATVAKGIIVTPHTLRFWRFFREERRREYRLVRGLAVAAAISLVLAVGLAVFGDTLVRDSTLGQATALWVSQIRGYAERIGSALLVAILTTFVNLSFDYGDWRSEKTEVDWLFG